MSVASLLHNLFRWTPHPESKSAKPTYKPSIDSLETREVPGALTLIKNVSATSTMISKFTNLQNAVNGTGLATLSLTARHEFSAPFNVFLADTAKSGTITFNLHGSYFVGGFSFWNLNLARTDNGIKGVIVQSSVDGIHFTNVYGAPTQFAKVPGVAPFPQQFSFPAVKASYMRFVVLGSYGGAGGAGFAEVQFGAGASGAGRLRFG